MAWSCEVLRFFLQLSLWGQFFFLQRQNFYLFRVRTSQGVRYYHLQAFTGRFASKCNFFVDFRSHSQKNSHKGPLCSQPGQATSGAIWTEICSRISGRTHLKCLNTYRRFRVRTPRLYTPVHGTVTFYSTFGEQPLLTLQGGKVPKKFPSKSQKELTWRENSHKRFRVKFRPKTNFAPNCAWALWRYLHRESSLEVLRRHVPALTPTRQAYQVWRASSNRMITIDRWKKWGMAQNLQSKTHTKDQLSKANPGSNLDGVWNFGSSRGRKVIEIYI